MDKLEKFIVEHRTEWSDQEPADGHFDRFMARLEAEERRNIRPADRFFFLKVAAGLIIVFSVSVLLFDFASSRLFNRSLTSGEAAIPADIRDAEQYYGRAASEGMGNIQKLACCGQDTKTIRTIADREVQQLDASSAELRQALKQNPGDERIQAALIRTQQMKETVVRQVVDGMTRVNR